MIEVALIVSVDTDDYDAALAFAETLADGVSDAEGLFVSAVLDYDTLPNGQRIVYLPAVAR